MKMMMTTRKLLYGVLSTALIAIPVHADMGDDAGMQAEEQRIDKDTPGSADQTKVDALAQEFKVPPSTVQDLRNKKEGWGEITNELAIAQKLAASDPKAYPTFAAALSKVEALRAQGMGWGKIAHTLGFKLGPIVREVRRAREELREVGRPEAEEKEIRRGEEMGRPMRTERSEGLTRSERMERGPAEHGGR